MSNKFKVLVAIIFAVEMMMVGAWVQTFVMKNSITWDSNTVIAIAAVMALIASIISMWLAIKHNIDSVKPVCSVYFTDYKNFISVRIANDGIGPLIIKEAKYRCGDEEVSCLFDLLPPEVKTMSYHRVVFTLDDKWAISAGKRLYLISIEPEDDTIRNMLRDKLKDMEISIKYTDVYNSHFKKVTRSFNTFEKEGFNIIIKDPVQFMSMN